MVSDLLVYLDAEHVTLPLHNLHFCDLGFIEGQCHVVRRKLNVIQAEVGAAPRQIIVVRAVDGQYWLLFALVVVQAQFSKIVHKHQR